jgi:NADH-quinone oxidoreductase subunit L
MEDSFNGLILLWIVLFPLIGAALNGIAGCFFGADKKVVGGVAVGAVALSFAFAAYSFVVLLSGAADDPSFALTQHVYEWFSVEMPSTSIVPVNVRFTMDALSGIMSVMVTGIGLLIHIYSLGYMSEESSYARFFAYLNLFMASMLILVLGSNLPLMFVGWEGVGLCSYLLIGFWYENPTYAAAGKKAFIVNRIGDFGVLMGMFVLLSATSTFEFADINQKAAGLTGAFRLGTLDFPISTATLAALFLFLGCTGKSAQIPLYVWLPDAMAGPTPVSALIHAATMVTSGVYLCCRLSPVFAQSPVALAVIAVVGTATALLAASIALVQNQLKKVLAYSTVSQLGFMFAAVGVGAFGAGIFHVFTHAFFKACLFLGAGSVMHAVHAHGDADLGELGGMKKWMPVTRVTFLISCLAIAGFPLTAGFFSKDMILHGALSAGDLYEFAPWLGYAVFGALCLGAFTTAFYMFRLYFLTFEGEYRGGHGHGHGEHAHDDHGHGHAEPHESESAITVPLAILAFGALLVGFLGMPAWAHLPDWWSEWLHGVVASVPGAEEHHHDSQSGMVALIAGSVAGLGGIGLAYAKYYGKPWQPAQQLAPLHQLLMDKWRVDELYDTLIIRPFTAIAVLSGNIDRVAVDGLTKTAAWAVAQSGYLFTRLQNGVVHAYGAAMVFGLVGIAWWMLYPHPHIDVAVKGDAAHLVAGAGLGYEYRWDFDSDGKFEIKQWSKEQRDVLYAYEADQLRGVELTLTEVAGKNRGKYSERLAAGEQRLLDPRDLGDGWRTDPESVTPPLVMLRDKQVLVHPNASSLRINGVPAQGKEVPVPVGATIQFGEYTKMRVDAVVEATLEVRNVFGNVARTRERLVVQPRVSAAKTAARAVDTGSRALGRASTGSSEVLAQRAGGR